MDFTSRADDPARAMNARGIMAFVLSILITMAAASYLTTAVRITNAFNSLERSYTEESTALMERTLEQYFFARLSSLSDKSALPILVNAVMHPPTETAVLVDFLSAIRLFGEPVNLSLLDVMGEVIATTGGNQKQYTGRWLNQIMQETIDHHVEIFAASGELTLRYAVPVRYQGYAEGLLVAEHKVDSNAFAAAMDIQHNTLSLDILDANGTIIGTVGALKPKGFTSSRLSAIPLENRLLLHRQPYSLDAVLYELLLFTLLVTAFLSLVFLGVFKRIGDRLFLEPHQRLQRAQAEITAINQRLSHANDELSQFAYRSSHDLRAPLTTIKGLAKFAQEDLADGEVSEVARNLKTITRQAGKLDRLVGDILDLSRADLADQDPDKIDLQQLIAEVADQQRLQAESKSVALKLNDAYSVEIRSQATRVTQILENLISNGIKYSDPSKSNRWVEVTALTLDEEVRLRVSDNGLGIPEEHLDKLFTMFQRFHSNVEVGSGLGLSIVKKHVDKLGGEIRCESSPAGTTFTVSLPKSAG